MSEQKVVFSKLFKKEELASQKVELNSIQALNRIISDGNKIYKRGVEFVNKKTELQKEAKTLNNDSKSLLVGGEKLINEFIKSAKDLGIDTSGIQELKDAVNVLGVLDTVEKQSASL